MKIAFIDITVKDCFRCSLSRAFAAPILGDATLYLNGYRMQPALVSFDDDSTWGQPSGLRYPVTNGNCLVPKGRLLTDVILERVENSMWRWQISEFRAKSMFFTSHAIATWNVTESAEGAIDVVFSYRYFASHWAVFPILWMFGVIQVRGMLQHALAAIKQYAESDNPMLYH